MARHAGRFEAGRIVLPKDACWLADFESELLGFPNGRYDDQVDALGLIAFLKANNGKYSYAHSGIGTTSHLSGEMFKHSQDLDLVSVPFGGTAPAVQSTLALRHTISQLELMRPLSFIQEAFICGAARCGWGGGICPRRTA